MGTCRRRAFRPALLVLVFLLSARAVPAFGQRGVVIERAPVVVERREFDPRRPPPDMPRVGAGMDAITEMTFGSSRAVDSTVVGRRRVRDGGDGDGRCVATVRVEAITVKLDLKVTIWLPYGARRQLVEHEDGHRRIAERVYEQAAERVARRAAVEWVGRTATGEGGTCAAAADAALKKVNDAFARAYTAGTVDVHDRVGARYDAITDHGRREEIPEAEAIEQAFEGER